jgi:primosomal protein N' (replication factor Y)
MEYVRVVVNLPSVSGEFDYHLPPALLGRVNTGHLVRVPFGPQVVQAVVLELVSQPVVAQTKDVQELIDPLPVLTPAQVELARSMAAHTLNPLAAMVELMLPVGLSQQADVLFSLAGKPIGAPQQFPEVQKRLLTLLGEKSPLRGRQIDRHFQRVDWRKAAQQLVNQGVLRRESILPPPAVRPKFIRTAQLAVSPDEAQAAMPALGHTPATQQRRARALRFLVDEPSAVAVTWVYAESGCNLADLQELAERELIVLLETEIFRDPLGKLAARGLDDQLTMAKTSLTDDQETALAAITASFDEEKPAAFLLYGVTGSGKTEIYLRATAEALRRGKSVFVLVPEIAITPQVVRRFLVNFPGQVGLAHSGLSDGERYDTWRRARSGQLKVIIGPRSALFLPFARPGLILVDECHDNSYYQSELPFYHAVWAAERYAQISGAVCVLGSATPGLKERYRSRLAGPQAQRDGLRSLELPHRFKTAAGGGGLGDLPPVTLLDMREELKSGNRGIFSRQLVEALSETLERGEQAILYLNRRGTATYVFCRDCGYVMKCSRCDTPMTFHTGAVGETGGLVCHRCGNTRGLPNSCPACKSSQIRTYGLGSEKVESEVVALLPKARVLRWDWETTREKDAHEMILSHFSHHKADVLVGTQMLAKGLDLPLVTLVGIVLADVGLTLPDPFATERTFQLLTQVAGRAGRSERGGRVIMQTFMPENPVIQMAARHDFEAFYSWEMQNRRSLGYPPFYNLMRLEYRHNDSAEAERQTRAMAERLNRERGPETELIGPVPCFFGKINGVYRWQIVVRGPNPAALMNGRVPDGWRVEVEPVSLL